MTLNKIKNVQKKISKDTNSCKSKNENATAILNIKKMYNVRILLKKYFSMYIIIVQQMNNNNYQYHSYKYFS